MKIEDFLSEPRFQPYFDYCEKNGEKALKLYQMNLRLNGAFFPILSMLEVALRNSIDKIMTTNYPTINDSNWITQLKCDIVLGIEEGKIFNTDFSAINNQLKKAQNGINKKIEENNRNFLKRNYRKNKEFKKKSYEEQETIINEELERKRLAKGSGTNKDILIANIDFGFWTAIFEPEPYKFIVSRPKNVRLLDIFGYELIEGSEKIQRSTISDKLFAIRKFRNRVAHNEPLIFVKQKFDAEFPKSVRNDIMFLLRNLNQNLELYSEDIYTIDTHLFKIEDYCESIDSMVKKESL